MNTHRSTVAYVCLDSIAHNIASFRRRLNPACELMAVVKADGYGHGAVHSARVSLSSGASRLGVAVVDEAVELRRAEIGSPILVLGHVPPAQADMVLRYGIAAAITDSLSARALSEAATRQGRRVKVHLKVDTGMHRLGVQPQDAVSFAAFLTGLPGVELEGVFTHYASADSSDLASARAQLRCFSAVCEALAGEGHTLIRHSANTAATLSLPESHLDMVRIGLGAYGMYPQPHLQSVVGLRPALTLVSRVSLVKWIEAGAQVGYGGTYVADSPCRVATVPVGYADGYPRALSGKGTGIIGGKRVPVIGRVAMDQLMIDVTSIPCGEGDEVVLIGSSGDESISVEELASCIDTINYEITTRIGPRVPRLYLRNGRVVYGRSLLGVFK